MKSRGQILEIAALREFDVLVVGGGIIGAGVALDAATRGLSVLLVERDDFASGASGRSTKIIDGGLHHLEQFRVNLTKALCQERALLEQLAPHLIRDFSFILPLTRDDRFFKLKAKIGLTIYDLLAGTSPGIQKHNALSQKEMLEAAPALSSSLVAAGLRFHDCLTDDSRLVLEVIKSACNEGASAINYMEAVDFASENSVIKVVTCRDRVSGNEVSIRSKVVVNAAGVWADGLLQKSDPDWQPQIEVTKGTHIMVPPSALETNTALLLPTEDGRYVFVVPWQRALMIGTTATSFSGDLNNPMPEREEIEYLINCVNRYLGEKKLSVRDVIAAWSGLHSLINEPAQRAKNGSNPHHGKTANSFPESKSATANAHFSQGHIVETADGMISLFGGKLTNYRLIAARAVDIISQRIPTVPEAKQKNVSRTKRIMLGGWSDKNDYLTATASIAAKARKLSIEPATLDHLISSYGKDAQLILEIVEKQPILNERICPDFPPIMAEVPFCVLREAAVSLQDLLFRRMRLGLLHQIQCKDAAPKVASLMQSLLNWDDSRATLELAALEKSLDAYMDSFRDVAAAVS